MKFCNVCDNLYYLKMIEDESTDNVELYYYCKKCGDQTKQEKSVLLSELTYVKEGQSDVNINSYIKYDPTIPSSAHIKCPNISCETNNESFKGVSKVTYYRYDDANLKYIYMCSYCDSSWKP